LIANEPKDFAHKVCELFASTMLWSELSRNARILVEEKYDWDRIARHLEDIYEKLLAKW